MKNIAVSICCITYNHKKYIEEAIESFLMQKTTFGFEILIHDDASTDGTQEIIKKYQQKYPDIIKPIYQLENQYSQKKPVSPLNYNRAKGKYIALCEGDDFWTDSSKLQKQFEYMENHERCGLCFHKVAKIDAITGKKIGEVSPDETSRVFSTAEIIEGGGGFLGTNSIFCKTEILQNLPEFQQKCNVGDYPLQIITASKDYAYFIGETMSAYRINVPNSWTDKAKKASVIKQKEHINNIMDMLRSFNKYSEFKYCDSVERKIKRLKLELLLLDNNIGEMKSKQYIDLYNNFSLKKRLKIYLKYYLKIIKKLWGEVYDS